MHNESGFNPPLSERTYHEPSAFGGSAFPRERNLADPGNDRGARFLEWTWDPDPLDSTCTVDYAYLLREADGSVRVGHDRHLQGLFPRATWLGLLEEAGFRARAVPVDHSELEPGTYELFVATR